MKGWSTVTVRAMSLRRFLSSTGSRSSPTRSSMLAGGPDWRSWSVTVPCTRPLRGRARGVLVVRRWTSSDRPGEYPRPARHESVAGGRRCEGQGQHRQEQLHENLSRSAWMRRSPVPSWYGAVTSSGPEPQSVATTHARGPQQSMPRELARNHACAPPTWSPTPSRRSARRSCGTRSASNSRTVGANAAASYQVGPGRTRAHRA